MAVQNVEKINNAVKLRREGNSYTEIAKTLKVSRATVCGWVKNTRLTETEKAHLQKSLLSKVTRGRMKAAIAIRSQHIYKEKVAYENAEKTFAKYSKDSFFMLGLGLCTTGGLKKGSVFQFASSDPAIIKIVLKWLEKYLKITPKDLSCRLFLVESHKNSECERFWATTLHIAPARFAKTVYMRNQRRKDKGYNGSLSVMFSRIAELRTIIAWQKLTMRYYG